MKDIGIGIVIIGLVFLIALCVCANHKQHLKDIEEGKSPDQKITSYIKNMKVPPADVAITTLTKISVTLDPETDGEVKNEIDGVIVKLNNLKKKIVSEKEVQDLFIK